MSKVEFQRQIDELLKRMDAVEADVSGLRATLARFFSVLAEMQAKQQSDSRKLDRILAVVEASAP